MTDEQLAAIRAMLDDTEHARERLTGLMGPGDRPRAPVLQAALDLFAEVERLKAENTALRERIEPSRRKALSILHQIYDLGVDPKNAHLAANARTLLDQEGGVR